MLFGHSIHKFHESALLMKPSIMRYRPPSISCVPMPLQHVRCRSLRFGPRETIFSDSYLLKAFYRRDTASPTNQSLFEAVCSFFVHINQAGGSMPCAELISLTFGHKTTLTQINFLVALADWDNAKIGRTQSITRFASDRPDLTSDIICM
jgi:hypothetical protein